MQVPVEGRGAPQVGVTGSYEAPNVDAWNITLVSYESGTLITMQTIKTRGLCSISAAPT